MHPSEIIGNDVYIIDGQIIPYEIEFLECGEIEVDILDTTALISGTLYVTCETEIYEYNPVRDPGEDAYNSISDNYITFALQFNFDLEHGEVCKEFEITSIEVTDIN